MTFEIPREVGLLLVLRRLRDGRVTAPGPGPFADHGRPFPGVLVPFLRELIAGGNARIDGRQVRITDAGLALLAGLEADQSTVDEPE